VKEQTRHSKKKLNSKEPFKMGKGFCGVGRRPAVQQGEVFEVSLNSCGVNSSLLLPDLRCLISGGTLRGGI
jgi:hypothetical protein